MDRGVSAVSPINKVIFFSGFGRCICLQFNPEGAVILNAICVIENATYHIVCEAQLFSEYLFSKAFQCILFLHNIPSDCLRPTSYFQSYCWALLFTDNAGSL